MRRWLPWIILGLIVWWAVDNPHSAALAVHHIATFFSDLGKHS